MNCSIPFNQRIISFALVLKFLSRICSSLSSVLMTVILRTTAPRVQIPDQFSSNIFLVLVPRILSLLALPNWCISFLHLGFRLVWFVHTLNIFLQKCYLLNSGRELMSWDTCAGKTILTKGTTVQPKGEWGEMVKDWLDLCFWKRIFLPTFHTCLRTQLWPLSLKVVGPPPISKSLPAQFMAFTWLLWDQFSPFCEFTFLFLPLFNMFFWCCTVELLTAWHQRAAGGVPSQKVGARKSPIWPTSLLSGNARWSRQGFMAVTCGSQKYCPKYGFFHPVHKN